ncbi:inversin-B-like [Gigantopelta aegis]|uniref:inversin-B-like n=1 Tax=Gigantopelta aegis TaxID=1735272 RepID=UPI001B888832|nr:inversin-B-like [Gigantopelta aegis]
MDLPPPATKRLIKTALHQAILDCRLHQVRLLVFKHGVNIDSRDINGRTPLMLSCMIANPEYAYKMAKILLKSGASLNVKDNMERTALSYACMNGREGIVARILKEDVLDINEPDTDGNTPLHHSTLSSNPKIVEMLVEAFKKFGLNADRRNNLGYTALLLACKFGHYVSAHILLTRIQASPTLRDGEMYLNAADWTRRSHDVRMTLQNTIRRSLAFEREPTQHTLSFSRESTMYQKPFTPVCHHTKAQKNPLSCSFGSVLKLPALFETSVNDSDRSEVFIDGLEARQVLLNEIMDTEPKQRPFSTKTTNTRWAHPSTAKLMSLGRRSKTAVIPDMVTLFRIYSEQYQPDWKKYHRRSERKVTLVTSLDNTSAISGELPSLEAHAP